MEVTEDFMLHDDRMNRLLLPYLFPLLSSVDETYMNKQRAISNGNGTPSSIISIGESIDSIWIG